MSACRAGWSALLLAMVVPSILFAQQTGPQQDCNGAFPVCQASFVQPLSFAGFGALQESANSCLNGESSSVWYVFTAQTTGSLAFNLNTALDYDFALYNITANGCAGVPTSVPVRCNYSGQAGNTGLVLPAQPELPPLEVSGNGEPMMPALDILAGQTYALLVNNFNNNDNGYTLDFGGTASITDNTPPSLQSAALDTADCSLVVNLNEPVLCSSIAADGSDFQISASAGFTVTSAAGVGCGTFTRQIRLKYDYQPEICGSWIVQPKVGSDGDSLIDNCNNPITGGRVSLATPVAAIPALALPAEVCDGTPIFADGAASQGEKNYFWSVVESDANWNVIGPECYEWFSGQAGTLDVRKFGQKWGCPLKCGRYYRVKLAVQNCCTGWSETVRLVRTNCLPKADAGPDRVLCCRSQTPIPLGTPGITGMTYAWTSSDGLFASNQPTVSVLPKKTTTYTVKATDAKGCSAIDSAVVNHVCVPIVSVTAGKPASCCDGKRTLTANVSGADSFLWNPGGATTPQIQVNPSVKTIYTVQAKNVCYTSKASVTLEPAETLFGKPDLIYPKAFTPNGDGHNDRFVIYHLGKDKNEVPSYKALSWRFLVFDRWGCEIVNLGNDDDVTCPPGIPNGQLPLWDGRANRTCKYKWPKKKNSTYAGDLLPVGVYVWRLYLANCSPGGMKQIKTDKVTVDP